MYKDPLKKQIKICNFKMEISNHYFFQKWKVGSYVETKIRKYKTTLFNKKTRKIDIHALCVWKHRVSMTACLTFKKNKKPCFFNKYHMFKTGCYETNFYIFIKHR